MARTSTLTKRIASVHTAHSEQQRAWLSRQIADRLGITVAELERETRQLVQRWEAVGAMTNAERIADTAQELGIDPAELRAELDADPLTGHLWRD